MKRNGLLLLFSMYMGCAVAQQASIIKQVNGKTKSTRVIAEQLTHIIDSAHITGLQVAIVNNNQTVWMGSFGLKDMEQQLKLGDNTEMYAASLTKPVSAYLFLRLVDKGIFSLDTPVRRYLKMPIGAYPKWKDLSDDTMAFNQITPRMLLSHSSGMPVLRAIYNNSVKLIARPGEKFYYSNEGMNLLGFMIEEYSGRKLEIIAKEEIFAPLQMARTSMIWEPVFEKDFSNAYFKEGKKYGSERRETAKAAGSMTTTAADYAKFIISLMDKKGLSAKLYKQFLSTQIRVRSKRGFGPLKDSLTTDNDATDLAWGLGIGLFKSPYGPALFHSGHGDANQNYFVAFPVAGVAIVLMSNSENFEHASSLILKTCIGDQYSPLEWLGHQDEQ